MTDGLVQGKAEHCGTKLLDVGRDDMPSSPSVGILGSDQEDSARMAARLRELRPDSQVSVLSSGDDAPLACEKLDVLLVALGVGVSKLGFVFSLLPENPWMHTVFMCSGQLCPEVEAVRCLGARYVVAEPEGWSWLEGALLPLTRHSRALRALKAAQVTLPPRLPMEDGSVQAPWLALPEAEQRFRESYLRGILARARTQREAALLAGIPYTTLRSMIEKLLI